IVDYDQLDVGQQADSRDLLASILDHSLGDAGILPVSVSQHGEGSARMLTFRANIDIVRVLAVMPRRFEEDLNAHNQVTAPHARLRMWLSYVHGPAAIGTIGRSSCGATKVARISNDSQFRQAMRASPDTYVGVMVDDYLYTNYVQQESRPDLHPEEYVATHVSDREIGFEADAWMRLVGRSANEARNLIRVGSATTNGAVRPGAGRRRLLTNPLIIAALITGCLSLAGTVITVLVSRTSPAARHASGASRSVKAGATHPRPSMPIVSAAAGQAPQPIRNLTPRVSEPMPQPTSPATTPSAAPSSAPTPSSSPPTLATFTETVGDPTHTWTNFTNAGGYAGPTIATGESVEVTCVAQGFKVADGNTNWYKIASSPWNGTYYASADAFYNDGSTAGSLIGTPLVDPTVPAC
ncbi:MAG TPA: hypothetical protein VLX90_05175, partial [Steroidobacteraceae bacterium]|nr:hypothetical protein [Steroidobacteraceae bacterium]